MRKNIISLAIIGMLLLCIGCSDISNELTGNNLVKEESNNESSEDTVYEVKHQELIKVQLEYVVDGDTIIVTIDGEKTKVRMIGIDTPESVHSDESKNNVYGDMASEYTRELLAEIETVYLQYDVEREDDYGRTLAYVWLTNNIDTNSIEDMKTYMVNVIVLADGYGKDRVYKPNDTYAEIFSEICNAAEENTEGLWQYEEFVLLWQ